MKKTSFITQLARFLLVGGIATAVHSSVYFCIVAINESWPFIANFAGYFVAVIFSFFGQKHFTFKNREAATKQTVSKFLFSSMLGLGLNSIWVFFVVSLLNLHPYYALIGIAVVTPAISFVLLKYWVFKEKKLIGNYSKNVG